MEEKTHLESERMMSSVVKVAEIEDLISQILIRIPAKPLLKFKCVCKQWLRLISDPRFCASHAQLHHNPTPTAIFFDDFDSNLSELAMIPLKSLEYATELFVVKDHPILPASILQSCNGLLLCCSSLDAHPDEKSHPFCQDFDIDNDGWIYYICNPTTGQIKRLCMHNSIKERLRMHGKKFKWLNFVSCLVFNPKISPYYKIIVFSKMFELQDPTTYTVEAFIYSSETDSWISHQVSVNAEIFSEFYPCPVPLNNYADPVYCIGGVHWSRYDWSACLVCFDVDTMIFRKLEFGGHMLCIGYVGELEGHLYCTLYKHNFPWVQDVVEIAPDYSGFLVKYHVDLQFMTPCIGVSILSIIHDQDTNKRLVVTIVGQCLIVYDLTSGDRFQFRESTSRLDYGIYKGYPYHESLICV